MKGFFMGDPRAVAAGKRGGARSGEARRQQRAKRWKRLGVDPLVAVEIERRSYQAGWRKGYTARLRKAAQEGRA
jgi:hypothetical protein